MQKTLITGATGGLGSAVAHLLKEKNVEQHIAVLVRDAASEKAQELASQGFEVRQGDYDDLASLVLAFEGVDNLYFVSGNDIANRAEQHKNVVNAAKQASVSHIVYTSLSANGLSKDAPLYGAMAIHFETESWIEESGLTYTFLRHNLYSEVIPMFLGGKEQILASKTAYLPTGNGKTAFVPKIELAEAGANVLAQPSEHQNTAYEMNGSDKVSFSQVAAHLSDITGESIAYVSPEVGDFEQTMTQYGVPAELIGMTTAFSLAIADGVFDTTHSDLEKLLGRPSLSAAEFLAQVYA